MFVFFAWILPLPSSRRRRRVALTLALAATGAIGLPFGVVWSRRRSERALCWLREERTPAPAEVYATLRIPLGVAIVQLTLWSAAGVVFLVLNLQYGRKLAIAVFITILLGAAVTVALAYLLLERILRPVAERALAAHVPDEPAVPGVAVRVLFAWAAGTAAPLFGMRCWRAPSGVGSATCRPTGSAARCSSSPASGS